MQVECGCGAKLKAPSNYLGSRAVCPLCGRMVNFAPEPVEELAPVGAVSEGAAATAEAPPPPTPRRHADEEPTDVVEFLDPPSTPIERPAREPKTPWTARLLTALLDPRSIQWFLVLGGALMVLGLVIWLVSLGVFESPAVVAAGLIVGSLAVHSVGCLVYLKTSYRVAGQALTFLGCVLLPLNLWYLHHQDLLTLQGGRWVGAAVCSLLYIFTVFKLRDPLFMYAVEGGVTLTAILLLATLGRASDPAAYALLLMALGLVSLHCERAFSEESSEFPRKRFGMPLFWSSQVQIAASLLVLLASQVIAWLASGVSITWSQNLLTDSSLVAGGLWLAGVYAYLYSDFVVRRIGLYTYLAAVCLILAEATLIGASLGVEAQIAILTITALAASVVLEHVAPKSDRIHRLTEPLAMLLSALPVAMGLGLHLAATSEAVQAMGWTYESNWLFVGAMLLVTAANRIGAFICRQSKPTLSTVYFFFSGGALIVAAAGLLRQWGLVQWSEQAPLLMLIPIGCLIASRMWRGRSPERPLAWVAQAATAVIMLHVLLGAIETLGWPLRPVTGDLTNLLLALVFVEATAFYVLAAWYRRRSTNVFFAIAAACGAVWQTMGYIDVPSSWYTPLFAAIGVGSLLFSRRLGIGPTRVWRSDGSKTTAMRGAGQSAYQIGNAVLLASFLAAFFQNAAYLIDADVEMSRLASLAITTVLMGAAVAAAPRGAWRNAYITMTVFLSIIVLLMVNSLIDLTPAQKLEIFAVGVGLALTATGFVSRFSEDTETPSEGISVVLWLGSALACGTLLLATLMHRFTGEAPSLADELALVTVSIVMLIAGCLARMKSTTLTSGGALFIYLAVLICSLAYSPQLTMGAYLTVGGGVVFGAGVILSMFREKLLEIPERINQRQGVFQVMDWR